EFEDLAHHKVARFGRPGSHRDVDVLADQIHAAILDQELDVHFGIALEELRQRVDHLMHGDAYAEMHAQAAARAFARAADFSFGVLHLGEDAPAASHEEL